MILRNRMNDFPRDHVFPKIQSKWVNRASFFIHLHIHFSYETIELIGLKHTILLIIVCWTALKYRLVYSNWNTTLRRKRNFQILILEPLTFAGFEIIFHLYYFLPIIYKPVFFGQKLIDFLLISFFSLIVQQLIAAMWFIWCTTHLR